MDFYRKLARKPRIFLSTTGMLLHTFKKLLPQFAAAFLNLQQQRKHAPFVATLRANAQIGGGRCFNNDLANQLLMLLLYYRLYLTQDFMTLLFHADNKSLICRNIQLMKALY